MGLDIHRLPRLFVEQELEGHSLTLDEREAHYLAHVLRLKSGDSLVAFNGRGAERIAAVATLQRRGSLLDLKASHAALPESPLKLTLIQALPKSDAMDLIVQKATELGVHTVVPALTEFSVVRLDAERSARRVDHWRRIARSACEQCGRHRPPDIATPLPLADALAAIQGPELRLGLDPAAGSSLAQQTRPREGLVIAVGPEGGFGDTDWRLLDAAQFARVALGRRVLRAETAALAVCAIAQSSWGDL